MEAMPNRILSGVRKSGMTMQLPGGGSTIEVHVRATNSQVCPTGLEIQRYRWCSWKIISKLNINQMTRSRLPVIVDRKPHLVNNPPLSQSNPRVKPHNFDPV
jgi:hypothetical protein